MAQGTPVIVTTDLSEIAWPISIAPQTAEVIERVRRGSPELFGVSEERLLELYRTAKREPGTVASMLRLRFWDEYERSEGRSMACARIYADVCSKEAWETEIRNPWALAWIMLPIIRLQLQREELIHSLFRSLAPMMRMSPIKGDGSIDIKHARMQLEMLMYLDQKNSGGITQRIEQTNRSLNVNANLTGKMGVDPAEIEKAVAGMTIEQIEQKIREAREGTGAKLLEVKAE